MAPKYLKIHSNQFSVDFRNFLLCQDDVGRTEIFFQAVFLAGSGYRNDIRLSLFVAVLCVLGHMASEVAASLKLCGRIILAGQKSVGEGRTRRKGD